MDGVTFGAAEGEISGDQMWPGGSGYARSFPAFWAVTLSL